MTTFSRARSEEQRAVRRRAILGTAATMLETIPVADLSLNELSRRVGLAKSNVLRYFESREAVLLELLDSAVQDWLAELPAMLDDAVDNSTAVRVRSDALAGALAESLAARPMLCELLSSQAAVLERNVSPTVAATYKRATIRDVEALAQLVVQYLPELSRSDAVRFAGCLVLLSAMVWTHSQPSPAMCAAYDADPELAALRLNFVATVREVLQVMLSGLLARSEKASADSDVDRVAAEVDTVQHV